MIFEDDGETSEESSDSFVSTSDDQSIDLEKSTSMSEINSDDGEYCVHQHSFSLPAGRGFAKRKRGVRTRGGKVFQERKHSLNELNSTSNKEYSSFPLADFVISPIQNISNNSNDVDSRSSANHPPNNFENISSLDENISSSTFTSEAAFAVKPADIIGDCAINSAVSSGSRSPAQGAIFNDGQMQSNNKKKVVKGTAKKIKNGGKGQLEWRAMDPTVPNFDFSQNVGLRVDVPDGADPIFFMKLLLTDDIVAEIKDSSNHYPGHYVVGLF